jgi:hypothetical protein
MPAAVQRNAISPEDPALDVALGATDDLNHRLARGRALERAFQVAGDAEPRPATLGLQAFDKRLCFFGREEACRLPAFTRRAHLLDEVRRGGANRLFGVAPPARRSAACDAIRNDYDDTPVRSFVLTLAERRARECLCEPECAVLG